MDKNKVWIVRIDQVQNGEILSDAVFVYDNREAAYLHYAVFIEGEKKDIPSDWQVNTLGDADKNNFLMWEAYENGRYATDHTTAEMYCEEVRQVCKFTSHLT